MEGGGRGGAGGGGGMRVRGRQNASMQAHQVVAELVQYRVGVGAGVAAAAHHILALHPHQAPAWAGRPAGTARVQSTAPETCAKAQHRGQRLGLPGTFPDQKRRARKAFASAAGPGAPRLADRTCRRSPGRQCRRRRR